MPNFSCSPRHIARWCVGVMYYASQALWHFFCIVFLRQWHGCVGMLSVEKVLFAIACHPLWVPHIAKAQPFFRGMAASSWRRYPLLRPHGKCQIAAHHWMEMTCNVTYIIWPCYLRIHSVPCAMYVLHCLGSISILSSAPQLAILKW